MLRIVVYKVYITVVNKVPYIYLLSRNNSGKNVMVEKTGNTEQVGVLFGLMSSQNRWGSSLRKQCQDSIHEQSGVVIVSMSQSHICVRK